MKRKMLCGVAIFALIANIAFGKVPEYSMQNLLMYSSINQKEEPLISRLINPGIPIEFRKGDSSEDEIGLYPHAYPNTPVKYNHRVCQHFLGFKLDISEEYFCNVTYFGLKLTQMENDVDFLKFVLHMETDPPLKPKMKPLRMEMPVFKKPRSVAKEDFEGWAKDENVGIVSPFNQQQLDAISAPGQEVLLHFEWLKDLLNYVVYEGRPTLFKFSPITAKRMRLYVTSAIVLPSDDVNKLTELFKDETSRPQKRSKGSLSNSDYEGFLDVNPKNSKDV